jgi:hypothetical protein
MKPKKLKNPWWYRYDVPDEFSILPVMYAHADEPIIIKILSRCGHDNYFATTEFLYVLNQTDVMIEIH